MGIKVEQHEVGGGDYVSIRNEGANNREAVWLELREVPELVERLAELQPSINPEQLTLFDQDDYLDPDVPRLIARSSG